VFLIDTIKELKTFNYVPILFVHGTSDTFVNYEGTEMMYDEYKGEKEILLLNNKPHALLLEPDMDNIFNFFIEWIKNINFFNLKKYSDLFYFLNSEFF